EGHGTGITSVSVPLTATGDNRVLLVGVSWTDSRGRSVASVTYGGVACPPLITTEWFYENAGLALYSLPAPASGSHSVEATMSLLTSEPSVCALPVPNANQTPPFGPAVATASADAVTVSTLSLPSSANDLAVDLLGFYAFEHDPGPGQT